MLNFSDDGGPKPDRGAVLWKWVMQHIANKRKDSKVKVSNPLILHII